MKSRLSPTMLADILSSTQIAFSESHTVNVPAIAESLRRRHLADNVALEDVEAAVLSAAQRLGAMIEFDGVMQASLHFVERHDDQADVLGHC